MTPVIQFKVPRRYYFEIKRNAKMEGLKPNKFIQHWIMAAVRRIWVNPKNKTKRKKP